MITLIPAPIDESPMQLLLACHGRIRKYLKICWQLGEAGLQDLEAIQNSARDSAKYFLEALPLHMLDEHDSIMPRLSGLSPRMDAALARMQLEHLLEEDTVRELVGYCETLSGAPLRLEAIREDLRQCVRRLTVTLESHLSGEEREIFPALLDLPIAVQTEIVAEMRARRNHD
jgi:hemerythrin-like domain-containing protein